MRLALYANDQPLSQEIKATLTQTLKSQPGLELVGLNQVPDLVLTIGGDGTLLSAFHYYQEWIDQVKFLGLHTGHLGFYADWQRDEVQELVDCLVNHQADVVSYPLLEVQYETDLGQTHRFLALNEMILRAKTGTMVCDVRINDYYFERFRGDGLCIATPTGSTGVNKSLGGAVIHPRLDAIQMTEMASLNNRIYRTLSSPIVIPKDEWFRLTPHHTSGELMLMMDHLADQEVSVKEIIARQAQERIQFAVYRHTHYWDRVKDSFIGCGHNE